MKKTLYGLFALTVILFTASCDKKDQPAMGDYVADSNPPNGPLKFYVAFDGTSANPLMNAVDSMRATFPSDNPFTNGTGIAGSGVTGVNQKFIKYPSFNTWAASSSFTVSLWFKQDGQTKNNTGGNGPQYFFSMKAADGYHWSNAVGFLFIEGNNTACAVKSMFVSPSSPTDPNSAPADAWFTWENGNMIAGLCDNQWHHLALVYDETNSSAKLYIDGTQNPNVGTWAGHGALRLATTKITEYRVGAGPSNGFTTDDWLAASFKGGLDQLRMYNTVLTGSEIEALFVNKK